MNIICKNDGLISEFLPNQNQVDVTSMLEPYGFTKFKLASFDDVVKNPNVTYFYFVHHTRQLCRHILETGSVPISDEVYSYLKNHTNLNLIFLNPTEPDTLSLFEILESKLSDVNLNQIFVLNANYKLDTYFGKINVHTIKKLPLWISHYFNVREENLIDKDDFWEEKKLFFTCHNRNIKSHRYGILCLLKKHKMLDDTDWSLLRGFELNRDLSDEKVSRHYLNEIFDIEQIRNLKDELGFLTNIDIKKCQYEESFVFDRGDVDYNDVFLNNIYKDSYVNIITETHYEPSDIVHISEKSFIPFYFNQIPIFVASHHHVKYLRETFDFDLFDDLVSHDYDDEVDNIKRMKMIETQLRILYNNRDYVVDFYKNNKSRFLKNKKKILNVSKYIDDKQYFNKISNDFYNVLF